MQLEFWDRVFGKMEVNLTSVGSYEVVPII